MVKNKMEDKEIVVNKYKFWGESKDYFFISKTDESGTLFIKKTELPDLKELIKKIEKEFTKREQTVK